MAHIAVTRASALPGAAGTPSGTPSGDTPYGRLVGHAGTHGDASAHVVRTDGRSVTRTWSEVADTVQAAAAGLVRSGLRADQVVVSLLPAAHEHPELDLALRIIGAVVVHVAPDVTTDDLLAGLGGAPVRLVVADTEADLERLQGLTFPHAQLFTVDGGRGWQHLLELGAERLRMDPDLVERLDRVVDPAAATPRLLAPRHGFVRLTGGEPVRLGPDAVAVVVGHESDPVVQHVTDAHLASGCTLVRLPHGAPLARVVAQHAPTVLGLAAGVGGALTAAVRVGLDELGTQVVAADAVRLEAATLPLPPPVLMGDPADLPRRARRDPGREFQLDNDREPAPAPDEPSAFQLPSLPLFGGESFLDKLLLSRAAQDDEGEQGERARP